MSKKGSTIKKLGDQFEKQVEKANNYYKKQGLLTINKVATPTTVIRRGKKIVSAFFSEQSTLDYVGVYKGIAIAFDAKRSQDNRFPLSNIHDHQVEFMKEWNQHGGYSFILIGMIKHNKYIILEYEDLLTFIELRDKNIGEDGKVKRGFASITIEDLLKYGYEIPENEGFIDYIKIFEKKFGKTIDKHENN